MALNGATHKQRYISEYKNFRSHLSSQQEGNKSCVYSYFIFQTPPSTGNLPEEILPASSFWRKVGSGMIKPSLSHCSLTNNKFYSEAVERMSVIDRLSEYSLSPFKACLCAGLVPPLWSMYSYRRQKLNMQCMKVSGILSTDRQTDISACMYRKLWYNTLVVFGKSPVRFSWMTPENVFNMCRGLTNFIQEKFARASTGMWQWSWTFFWIFSIHHPSPPSTHTHTRGLFGN